MGKYGEEDKYQLDDSHFAKKSTKIISVKLGNLELVAGSDEQDKYQLDDSQFANDKNKWMLSGFYRYRVYFYRHFM